MTPNEAPRVERMRRVLRQWSHWGDVSVLHKQWRGMARAGAAEDKDMPFH